MLPKKLIQGRDIGTGVVELIKRVEDILTDQTEVDEETSSIDEFVVDMNNEDKASTHIIRIKLDVGNTKRTTILKKLKSLNQVRWLCQCIILELCKLVYG